MPPALGVGAARACVGGHPDPRWVGCAGLAAPQGHWHQELVPAETRWSQFILAWERVGCQCEGLLVGMALPGSELGGLQSGAAGSLGGGQGGKELCWGDSPMGKVLGGKTGAFAAKLCGDFKGWGCKLSCGFD